MNPKIVTFSDPPHQQYLFWYSEFIHKTGLPKSHGEQHRIDESYIFPVRSILDNLITEAMEQEIDHTPVQNCQFYWPKIEQNLIANIHDAYAVQHLENVVHVANTIRHRVKVETKSDRLVAAADKIANNIGFLRQIYDRLSGIVPSKSSKRPDINTARRITLEKYLDNLEIYEDWKREKKKDRALTKARYAANRGMTPEEMELLVDLVQRYERTGWSRSEAKRRLNKLNRFR